MLRSGVACLVLLAATSGCSHAISTAAVRDAQLVARVKTALVNDAKLGANPIEVHVTGGVVRLTGRVASADDVARARLVAMAVPGVAEVIADLQTGPSDAASPAPAAIQGSAVDDEGGDDGAQWFAIGALVGRSMPPSGELASDLRVRPLLRLGSGRGLRPALGFGWFRTDWTSETSTARIGKIYVRPVMGGLAYGFQKENRSLSIALLAGVAFNSLSLPEVLAAEEIPIDIDNSLAVRPGVSFWFDMSRRFALHLGADYLFTRPAVRVLENGQLKARSLRADSLLVHTGLVYKVF